MFFYIKIMSSVISATEFRSNLFQFLDASFQKKKEFRIKRKNQFFLVIPEDINNNILKPKFKLTQFKGNKEVVCSNEDLNNFVTPFEWNEPNIV